MLEIELWSRSDNTKTKYHKNITHFIELIEQNTPYLWGQCQNYNIKKYTMLSCLPKAIAYQSGFFVLNLT